MLIVTIQIAKIIINFSRFSLRFFFVGFSVIHSNTHQPNIAIQCTIKNWWCWCLWWCCMARWHKDDILGEWQHARQTIIRHNSHCLLGYLPTPPLYSPPNITLIVRFPFRRVSAFFCPVFRCFCLFYPRLRLSVRIYLTVYFSVHSL